MGECFHWTAQGLLANQGKSVGIIYDNPAQGIRFRMCPLTEVIHFITNCVNTAIFFTAQPEN